MVKAAIFDMDGVIIDSEGMQSSSFEHVLTKHGKKPIYNDHGIIQEVGVGARTNLLRLKKLHDLESDIEALYEQKSKAYEELLKHEDKAMPGVEQLLRLLKKHAVKTAIASSSPLKHINMVLNQLTIFDLFDTIVSGDEVKRSKPAPDVFLRAAEQLSVDPADCIVLEDAPAGVVAAKSAGMKVIAIPNEFTKKHSFQNANLIVSSLEEVSWNALMKLFVP